MQQHSLVFNTTWATDQSAEDDGFTVIESTTWKLLMALEAMGLYTHEDYYTRMFEDNGIYLWKMRYTPGGPYASV